MKGSLGEGERGGRGLVEGGLPDEECLDVPERVRLMPTSLAPGGDMGDAPAVGGGRETRMDFVDLHKRGMRVKAGEIQGSRGGAHLNCSSFLPFTKRTSFTGTNTPWFIVQWK